MTFCVQYFRQQEVATMQTETQKLTFTVTNRDDIPQEIIQQGNAIWDAYAYVEMISNRIYDLKAYEEKMIGQLPHCAGSRITCVKEGRTPRCQNAGQSWPILMTVHGSEQPTHLLNIEYKTYPVEPSFAGRMPVINVFFSHNPGITEFAQLPFLNGETDLNHGYACFRRRTIYEPKLHQIFDQENWGIRAHGRLIWCEESINSIDRAGWGFSIPMAAVQTEEDFDICILAPLKILMQGVDPDQTPIPFSQYTLQYECNAA